MHMLFVRLDPKGKDTPLWEYRGDYESTVSATMTAAEFAMQRQDVTHSFSLSIFLDINVCS